MALSLEHPSRSLQFGITQRRRFSFVAHLHRIAFTLPTHVAEQQAGPNLLPLGRTGDGEQGGLQPLSEIIGKRKMNGICRIAV